MAADQAALMARLGHESYGVAGHDRGGRVGHRLARDAPARVAALAVLDNCPTEHMYRTADCAFATGYYHWFFLIQPAPLPERLIGADPDFYLDAKMEAWSGDGAVFDPAARAEYRRCFAAPGTVHATCEDYRASAGIDLEHDAADSGRRLPMPLLALWGALGLVHRSYDVPEVWRGYADDVEGRALSGGHFLPEEAPGDLRRARGLLRPPSHRLIRRATFRPKPESPKGGRNPHAPRKNPMATYKFVYHMDGVSKTIPGGKKLFENIRLNFLPGVKIGVVGANGAGKSTLLKIMAGMDKDFAGEAWAAEGARVGYLAQEPELDAALDVRGNVMKGVAAKQAKLDRFNELAMNYSDETAEEMAALQDEIDSENLWELDTQIDIAMEALRCPPDDAQVDRLSGGETRRVALCKLLLEQPDMLLLDEPTNHLDAETIAWLQQHLVDYRGTILIVTHDRYFLDDITGWILELDRGPGIPYEGNYSAWVEQKRSGSNRRRGRTRPSPAPSPANSNGCGRAPRPGRPSPRPGSTPMKRWPVTSASASARRRSSSPTATGSAARSSTSRGCGSSRATSC